eukprot:1136721-Pelagomonas_calceolata.AAC.2
MKGQRRTPEACTRPAFPASAGPPPWPHTCSGAGAAADSGAALHKHRGRNGQLSVLAGFWMKTGVVNQRENVVTITITITMGGVDLQPGSLAARSAQLFQLHKKYP